MGAKNKKIQAYRQEIEHLLDRWAFVESSPERYIKRAEIISWLNNFKVSEISLAIKIMQGVDYRADNSIRSIVSGLAGKIEAFLGGELKNTLFFALGTSSASSGSMFLYQYRKELRLSEENFVRNNFADYLNRNINIVFFDDIIGSGTQATKFFADNLISSRAQCYYFSLFGFEKGIDKIKKETGFKEVIVGEILSEEYMAFSPNSEVFTTEEQKELKPFCQYYGKKLYKKFPLGYDDTQALIVFPHNTPNNTLPIIWASCNNEAAKSELNWKPLWDRIKTKDSKEYSLYEDLIVLCDGMNQYLDIDIRDDICLKKENDGSSTNYTIRYLDEFIYLKISKDIFFGKKGNLFLWLYRNKIPTDESTFNAFLEPNLKTGNLKLTNLGLFMNNRKLSINYESTNEFYKELLNVIIGIITSKYDKIYQG